MLCFIEATQILNRFNIRNKVLEIHCIQESENNENYRGLFQITTENKVYVCRISNEKNFPMPLVEKQSQFAMILHANGVNTARKYRCQNNYCIHHLINGIEMQITLEEYIGEDLSDVGIGFLKEFGEVLGRVHSVSSKHPFVIGRSFISDYIQNDKARFSKILEKAEPPLPDFPYVHIAEKLHDNLVHELAKNWHLLPMGAVHGDLGVFNNLMNTASGVGIIDFNLAGDEAFLGDVLSSYYASIHKYLWKDLFSGLNELNAFLIFWEGYSEHYSVSEIEIEYFPQVSALFDGLFYCKCAIEVWNNGFQEEALLMIKASNKHFDPSVHPFPQIVYEEANNEYRK